MPSWPITGRVTSRTPRPTAGSACSLGSSGTASDAAASSSRTRYSVPMVSNASLLQRRAPLVIGAAFALLVALGAVLVAHRHAALPPPAPALHPLAIVPAG